MNGLADGGRDWEGILMVNIKKNPQKTSALCKGVSFHWWMRIQWKMRLYSLYLSQIGENICVFLL